MNQFHIALDALKDWPDRKLITDITRLAETFILQFPVEIGQAVTARLMNPSTFASYKLPMFYLIDSIMKNVGGPYAAVFGKVSLIYKTLKVK